METSKSPTSDSSYEKVGELVGIFQRGERWYANFQHAGRQHRPSLKTRSKKEARRLAIKLEAELLDGRFQEQKRAPSIQTVIDDYKLHLRTENRAPKTLAKVDLVCRRALDLAVRRKATSILQLDRAFVDAYRAERVAAEAMPKTVLNETVILRQLVNFAKSRRMIVSDPLEGLPLKKVKPTKQPCWSWDEVNRILAAAKLPYRNCFIMLAESGMRIGECKWFTWKDVDFKSGFIAIRAKKGWKPKNGEDRLVPMSTRLRTMLDGLSHDGRWVFNPKTSRRFPDKDRQISERRTLESLKRTLRRLGLNGHLHTFRHSFISRALAKGIPLSTVQEWVGHLDPEVTKLYTHVLPATSQDAMKRLDATAGGGDAEQRGA